MGSNADTILVGACGSFKPKAATIPAMICVPVAMCTCVGVYSPSPAHWLLVATLASHLTLPDSYWPLCVCVCVCVCVHSILIVGLLANAARNLTAIIAALSSLYINTHYTAAVCVPPPDLCPCTIEQVLMLHGNLLSASCQAFLCWAIQYPPDLLVY